MKKILFLLTICFVQFSIGQSKTGTTIGQFLKIEPGSRAVAMGSAGTSLYGEVSDIYYNAAGLGRIKGLDVQFTYSDWIADVNYNYAAIAYNLPSVGTFALQVISLNSGEINVTTVDQPLGTGEKYTVTNFAMGIGFGLMLTDRVSVGMVANYFQENIWHSSINGYGLNFGVQYQVEPEGLTIGAGVSNFGPRTGYSGRDLYINYDFDPKVYGDNDRLPAELRTDEYGLPTTFMVGLSYPFKINSENIITLAADARHPNDNNESVNAGLEYNFNNLFFVRGGYRNLFLVDAEGGLVLGAGAKLDLSGYTIKFDYAWSDYGRLKDVHRFTIGLGVL